MSIDEAKELLSYHSGRNENIEFMLILMNW